MTRESSLQEQATLIGALQHVLEAEGAAVPRHETHISWVLVCGTHAFRVKKALRTPFLDPSTLARRRQASAEELRLNRRLAPAPYLAVAPITGTLTAPGIDGPGHTPSGGR